MYIHDLNPVLISFGFFEIRWYSLAYIFGILIGWWIAKKIIDFKVQNKSIDLDSKTFDDLISYIIFSIIIGGRLGYVIFYGFSYYLSNPFEIFKIWQGGMSFHGALIGIIFATYIFSKKVKVNSFVFLDLIACVAPIGIFFGRIANFINGELYGKPSNLFWSVIFPEVDKIPRHPSQLYEAALEGVVLFAVLIILIYKKSTKTGVVSALFMILYGLFRIATEQFREPDVQIGYLLDLISMGSLLSFFMILAGLFILRRTKNNEFA
jgi:phosphatidylglycerol:prolipoprotein diacylglycerol transferase|tara:strand:- start:280 stop:1074 length:795 start_codon:yes stop_codon:yes gene_type:complete